MATLEEMREIEGKYGQQVMFLAIPHLFDVGIETFAEIESIESIVDDVKKSHAENPNGFFGEDFEIAMQCCAWELSRKASAAEVICWCGKRAYYSVWEWENHDDDEVED